MTDETDRNLEAATAIYKGFMNVARDMLLEVSTNTTAKNHKQRDYVAETAGRCSRDVDDFLQSAKVEVIRPPEQEKATKLANSQGFVVLARDDGNRLGYLNFSYTDKQILVSFSIRNMGITETSFSFVLSEEELELVKLSSGNSKVDHPSSSISQSNPRFQDFKGAMSYCVDSFPRMISPT